MNGATPQALADRRCYHHGRRSAVACCPACGRFFCRECIAEHEGRVLCTACLRAEVAPAEAPRRRRFVTGALGAVASFLVLWLFFHALGRLLGAVPSTFHDRAGPAAAAEAGR